MMSMSDPHAGGTVLQWGAPLSAATLAMIMLHGRGAAAEDMVGLAGELQADHVAYLAPQAADHTWYPYSFLAPIPQNEPFLTSALQAVSRLVAHLRNERLPARRIVLLGFSQGACLALEYAVRHPLRYGGVVGLSGGLIGPPGPPRDYAGSLDGTPVFLGCSDIDPHIPLERVHESADVFRRMGAAVDERIYPRMDHSVNADEIDAVRGLLRQ
jgi:predicted esterase